MKIANGAVALALACALLTGCNNGGDQPPRNTASTGGSDVSAKTAQEALARGGLSLPQGAEKSTLATIDGTPYLKAYLVTFSAPRSAAVDFCSTGDLGGDLPALKLSEEERQLLGANAKPDGARYCSSQLPSNSAWNRTVLVENGDPALVRVSVARMGR